MGIASVHYLSMNVRDGIITAGGAFSEQVSQTITPSLLQPSTGYTIVWGDATSNTTFTSNSSGTTTAKAHTYERGGTYVIEVKVTATNQVAARTTVDVAFNDGTIAADGTVTKDVEETFTLASLPANRSLVIAWGDTTTDTVTTNGSGGATQTHTYTAAGARTVTVTDTVTNYVYATLQLTVLAA